MTDALLGVGMGVALAIKNGQGVLIPEPLALY